MSKPSEGKVVELWDELINRIPEEYFEKRAVPGLSDVQQGIQVNVPTTVYNTSGDDASGVAGVLMPSGEFVQASSSKVNRLTKFWEFDETLRYVTKVEGDTKRVVGDSWRGAQVVWDGVVNGSISQASLDGADEDDSQSRAVVKRRQWDTSLTGDWESTGELWRAIRRGTGQRSRELGIQHLNNQSHSENLWDTFGDGEKKVA